MKRSTAIASTLAMTAATIGVTATAASADPSPSCKGTVNQVCTDANGNISRVNGNHVTPAVGVDFRDQFGNKLGCGVYPKAELVYLGFTRKAPNGDILVKMFQRNTPATDEGYGTGDACYANYIPVKYLAN